jgi:hypothetical protein
MSTALHVDRSLVVTNSCVEALADMKPTSTSPGRHVKGALIRIIPVLVRNGAGNWATLHHCERSEA